MDRWIGKIAVVTGASSGIGASIVEHLAKAGVITIGLARRKELIDEIIANLPANVRTNLHAIKCDVSNESELVNIFREIEQRFGGIDILVNNAGIGRPTTMLVSEGNSQAIQEVVNTNLFAIINATREVVQSMLKRKTDGHIIHMNSIFGHSVPFVAGFEPLTNVYHATKYALTAITETHRQELIYLGTRIKVSSISPGVVDTAILPEPMKQLPSLKPEDIANAVLFVLGTPPHVQVHDLVIKPVGEPL